MRSAESLPDTGTLAKAESRRSSHDPQGDFLDSRQDGNGKVVRVEWLAGMFAIPSCASSCAYSLRPAQPPFGSFRLRWVIVAGPKLQQPGLTAFTKCRALHLLPILRLAR